MVQQIDGGYYQFRNVNQFRAFAESEYPQGLGKTENKTRVNLVAEEDVRGIVSLLVYDPPITNGRILPVRAYACSFLKLDPQNADMRDILKQASTQGLISAIERAGFAQALKQGRGTFLLKDRQFSSLLLEKVAERYSVVDNNYYSTPKAKEKAFAGIPREFSEFCFVPKFTLKITTSEITDSQLEVKVLAPEQEREIFTIFNAAKFYLRENISKMAHSQGYSIPEMRQLEQNVYNARNIITNANIPLVLARVKNIKYSNMDFQELVSEGNTVLLRAIEGFDVSKGFKFSTYFCKAIFHQFSRAQMLKARDLRMFPAPHDSKLETGNYPAIVREEREDFYLENLREVMRGNLAHLNEDEEMVIRHRFAIPKNGEILIPETLKEVGKIIGLTRERVRQVQDKALDKIKKALEKIIRSA